MGYKPIGRRRGGKVSGVCIACYKSARKHVFMLTFGEDICKKMDWKPGSHAEMALGDGGQAGWLRLRTDENGHALYKMGKAAKALNVSLTKLADDQAHSREPAEHKIKGGALYVKLPKWARA